MLIGHTGVVKILAGCTSKLQSLDACMKKHFNLFFYFFFIYLLNNLLKAETFTKMQYTYTHKTSHKIWLIKVNYPILQKKKKKKKKKN